jgi:hypothetical protein
MNVQRRCLWKSIGAKSNIITSFRGLPKSVRLHPGILFAFIPESCSGSARNAVRLHPGIPLALPRNPQARHLEPDSAQAAQVPVFPPAPTGSPDNVIVLYRPAATQESAVVRPLLSQFDVAEEKCYSALNSK